MQSVSSRIWTRVAVSTSYDDNDYTTGTSIEYNNWIYMIYKNSYLKLCYLPITSVWYDYLKTYACV